MKRIQITLDEMENFRPGSYHIGVSIQDGVTWRFVVARNFHLTPGENKERAIAFALEEARALLDDPQGQWSRPIKAATEAGHE